MNNSLFILIMLIGLAATQTVTISKPCTCTQMLTLDDCVRKSECQWDPIKKLCAILTTPTTPVPETVATSYCDQFTVAADCASANPCAWNEKACTHFTGCSVFILNSNDKCQEISTRCITEGVHCIEKDACLTYETQTSCVINRSGRYCYWNTTDLANPKCEDADDCPKLPATLNTDALCRAQLSKCTASATGGCVESGIKCEEQKAEIACVTNKDRSQACFWTAGKCLDKTCDNAVSTLTTDQLCKDFISTCTTKLGGGCVTRTTCGAATIQAACVKDNTGTDCFWNGTTCVNKTCANALNTNKTNASCQTYLSTCITTGTGCVDNTGCESAKIKEACDKTLSGIQCHWDGSTCKVKTCTNAGSLYAGHDQCTTYMATCTANGATGCTDRTCNNAPTTNNTNDLCKSYHPTGNCVTKNGGGCRTNTTCEAIDINSACIVDGIGRTCFWDGTCKTKTCSNSPATNNSHALCQAFLPTCTVGNGGTCVDKTCESIQAEADCTTDLNNKTCIYRGKCYQKQCAQASKDIITHEDCQRFLSSCTLDNSGFGCMPLPLRCEAITQKSGCFIKSNGGKCGLQGNSCVDQTCTTAPADGTQLTTNNSCNTYKTGCVVNNNLNGCMDLPSTCAGRQKEENCVIETGANQKCQWNASGTACIDIKCENAHIVSLTSGVTQNGCWNYFNKNCIVNAAGNGCIARPKICVSLAEDACNQDNVLEGDKDCYWDSVASACKEYACTSITFDANATINHAACMSAMNNKCTVNAETNPTGCIALKACNLYTFAEQCVKDSDRNDCVMNGGDCIDQPCEDAPETDLFDTDSECEKFSIKCIAKPKMCTFKKATCADYTNSAACAKHTMGGKQQCNWVSNACINSAQFDCTSITGIDLTQQYCQYYNNSCSVNAAGTACIFTKEICFDYKVQTECKWAKNNIGCYWSERFGNCFVITLAHCTDKVGTSIAECQAKKSSCTWTSGEYCSVDCTAASGPFDYNYCKSYDIMCTVKTDGNGCVAMASVCSDYNNAMLNCTSSEMGICYPKSGPACQQASSAALTNCSNISGLVNLTAQYCKDISQNACSVLADQTGCVTKQDTCASYSNMAHCFSAINEPKCVLNSTGNGCVMFNSTDACTAIKINGLTNDYTDYKCKLFKLSCKKNIDSDGCEDDPNYVAPVVISNCSQIAEEGLTFEKCIKQLNTCSVNAAKTACVNAQVACRNYSQADCGYATDEGECVISEGVCVQKTCDNAPSTVIDMAGCQTYSSNCVIKAGGCSKKQICTSYLTSATCVKSITGDDCLWNKTAGVCVDKTCAAAEATVNYDTHDECAAIGKCTVKATTTKAISQGCIARAACNTYTIKEQCKVNASEVTCVWNENDPANPVCADKSCATAPLSTTQHSDCQAYFNNTCTVDIVDVDGTPTTKGCIPLKPCNLYAELQCHLSSEKNSSNVAIECAWNGTACANKSCATASNTEKTHTLCAGYWPGCTVNATNDGCVPIPDKCEGMTQEQCFDGAVDSSNKKCYWVDQTIGCVTRTCENSPNYTNETECDTYLSGCTTDTVKCKNKICEDYQFTTDALCKAALTTCTSNGSICVTRGSCVQAQAEAGCVSDSLDRLCQWVKPATGAEYCTLRNCNTAPNSQTTEEQCKQYFTPSSGSCTTKKDGGCTVKGACSAATVEAACKTDNNGADCQWDTDKCRLKECRDFSGTTHAACNKIRSNCTAGLNGKCAQINNCEATTVRAACIEGNNGPCLWISGYVNADGSKGACFSYESCKSLDWTQDSQCKLISSDCTTNGTECIGITSCAETNITGGCKTGTDGQCIQTVSAKGANDTICKKYTSCDVAYYLTHEECYGANPNCTSDYTNGCVSLAACSAYTKAGQCQLSKDGAVVDKTGAITLTGICIWDELTGLCRDQQCKDIVLTTEYECSAKLSTCSTDGTNCIVKGACNTYTTENACNNAGGTEGVCFWVVATDTVAASCRTKTCVDILNGTSTISCQGVANCVSNGTNCIVKVACASYTTKTGCQSQGTDGLCTWTEPVAPATQGKCALMTGCASAKDETSCNQASNRCSWNSITKVCAEHTCETYKTQIGKCLYFYTWDMKKYNICSIVSGKCVATDATTLAEVDCYTLTAYQYSWNPNSQKCFQCKTSVSEINNSNLTNNVTTTDFGQILAWTSVILAHFIV